MSKKMGNEESSSGSSLNPKRQVKSYNWAKLVKSRVLDKNKQTNKKQAVEFCRLRIHEIGESTQSPAPAQS